MQMQWTFDGPDFITESFSENFVATFCVSSLYLFQTTLSVFSAAIVQLITEYDRDWIFINESNNISETPYLDLIQIDNFAELHKEMHVEVDKSMRLEHAQLQKALCVDLKKKYKPPKVKKGKKKKGRGKKKKQPIDITAERPVQSLFDELVENDIVFDYPKCNLGDYISDSNFIAYELRNHHFT